MMKRVLLILLASVLVLGMNGIASATYYYDDEPIADAMVENGLNSFINFGGSDRISARGYAVQTGGSLQHSYLKFDLTEIVETAGPGAEILSVTFGIKLVEHNPGGFFTGDPLVSLHYVSDDTWAENSVTWNNRPDFYDEMDVPKNTVDEDVYYTWDLLADWDSSVDLAEGPPLLSLMIKATDETTNNYAIFYSREDTGVEVQPFLQIEYVPEPTTICLLGFGAVLLLRKRR